MKALTTEGVEQNRTVEQNRSQGPQAVILLARHHLRPGRDKEGDSRGLLRNLHPDKCDPFSYAFQGP